MAMDLERIETIETLGNEKRETGHCMKTWGCNEYIAVDSTTVHMPQKKSLMDRTKLHEMLHHGLESGRPLFVIAGDSPTVVGGRPK